MSAQSFDSQSASPWSLSSSTSNHSYRAAAMRAAIIAVVLLGLLAIIVLS